MAGRSSGWEGVGIQCAGDLAEGADARSGKWRSAMAWRRRRLVGDRLYVFSRQEGNEIARCLDAATGEEIWKDSYASEGTTGGASGFQGPRCSPTVVDGKVVTLGVRGILSCLDAETGKVLWRKDDFPGKWPQFYTSSSPMVVDGLCIARTGRVGRRRHRGLRPGERRGEMALDRRGSVERFAGRDGRSAARRWSSRRRRRAWSA